MGDYKELETYIGQKNTLPALAGHEGVVYISSTTRLRLL